MTPPVPDFLQLIGTPDPRTPRAPQPESQLPPTPHIPGTFEPLKNTLTKSRVNTENLGTPAPVIRQEKGTPGPRTPGFVNYPGAENTGSKIADAIAILAEADIQVVPPGGIIPTPNQEMNPAFRELNHVDQTFLRVLEKSGRVTFAAEIAGKSRSAFTNKRKRDLMFSELWDQALKYRAEIFEDEAIRRAVAGVRKDIYYKGVVCGSERVYSDALLSKLMEGNMPQKYRQNHKIELEGKMAVATLVLPATTSAEEWAAQNSGNIIEQAPEDEYAKDFD